MVKWRQEVSYRDSKESYLIGCDGHPPERFELFFSIRGCSEDPSTNVTDIDRSCTIYRDFFASIFRLSNYLIARSRAPFHRDRIDLVSSVHRVTGRSIKTEKLRIYGDWYARRWSRDNSLCWTQIRAYKGRAGMTHCWHKEQTHRSSSSDSFPTADTRQGRWIPLP